MGQCPCFPKHNKELYDPFIYDEEYVEYTSTKDDVSTYSPPSPVTIENSNSEQFSTNYSPPSTPPPYIHSFLSTSDSKRQSTNVINTTPNSSSLSVNNESKSTSSRTSIISNTSQLDQQNTGNVSGAEPAQFTQSMFFHRAGELEANPLISDSMVTESVMFTNETAPFSNETPFNNGDNPSSFSVYYDANDSQNWSQSQGAFVLDNSKPPI